MKHETFKHASIGALLAIGLAGFGGQAAAEVAPWYTQTGLSNTPSQVSHGVPVYHRARWSEFRPWYRQSQSSSREVMSAPALAGADGVGESPSFSRGRWVGFQPWYRQ